MFLSRVARVSAEQPRERSSAERRKPSIDLFSDAPWDESGGGSLRFEVTNAKTAWWKAALDLLAGGMASSGSEYVGKYPEVVAINARGNRLVLKVCDTFEQARNSEVIIREDFETLTIDEWRQRYDVPSSFILDQLPPGGAKGEKRRA